MSLITSLKNSKLLRAPLLAISRYLLSILKSGPKILRRAAYDAMPIPYLVTGHKELFVVATADKVIGRELFLHGEFDFNKLQAALAVLKREGIETPSHLIDVGANIGTIVIPALKRGLFASATAIEPHPDNLRLLRANLALNEVDHVVTILPQAVGDISDVQLFLQESETNSGNHSIGTQGIPVYSSKLDDLALPHQSLLWMDIEGYEGHALSGATNLLASGMPVVCELNPVFLTTAGGMETLQKILSEYYIYDLNSEAYERLQLRSLIKKISLREKEHQWTDILAIPKYILKNKMPLLSVIIPTYKRPCMLERTINSALNASVNSDVEVIVVPNGSDDTWKRIAQKFKNDLRVHWCPIPFANACAARNRGLTSAQGKYIRFLDDDDYLLPAATNQLILAEEKNLDICSAPLKSVTPSGACMFKYQLPTYDDFVVTTLLSIAISGFTEGSLFKRSCIKSARWREDITLYDDYLWMLDLAAKQEFLWMSTNDPVAAYVQHDGARLSRLKRSSLNSRPLTLAIIQMHNHLKLSGRITQERNMAIASALLTHAHSAFPSSPFFLSSIVQKALVIEPTAKPQQPVFRRSLFLSKNLLTVEWIILLPRYISRSYRRASWFIAGLTKRFRTLIKARNGTTER